MTAKVTVGLLSVAWSFWILSTRAEATGPNLLESHDAVVAKLEGTARRLGFDTAKYISILDNTAASLIDKNPGLGNDYPIWVLPSRIYPEMYSRDSFWTLAGYWRDDFLKVFVDIFSRNARSSAWNPPLNGQVPAIVRKNAPTPDEGRRVDESTLFWILGAKLAGKSVTTEPYLTSAHAWLQKLVTRNGLAMVSHGWIDAWEPISTPVVSANNQGLYAATLRALRDMGVAVTASEISSADQAYRDLWSGGYLRAYAGSDVVDVSSLMGEALVLYLWDESILGPDIVASTAAKFTQVFYPDGDFLGFKCLANPDGSFLDYKQFWSAADRDPGNYQNGASWLLYEGLAMYAAARHGGSDQHKYLERFIGRLKSEVRYEYSSKEFICTGGTCGACTVATCACPEGKCGAGSFDRGHSGYGWNLFLKRLLLGRDVFH